MNASVFAKNCLEGFVFAQIRSVDLMLECFGNRMTAFCRFKEFNNGVRLTELYINDGLRENGNRQQ